MSLFLLMFFSIYGGMHAYAFWKAKAGLGFGFKAGLPLMVLMVVMIFAPIIVRFAERSGYELSARYLSYVAFVWLGMIFLFISFAGAIDIYRAGTYFTGLILKKDLSGITLSSRLTFYIPLILSIVISVSGYFSALNIRIEKVEINTSKLPHTIERLKIAQISDVHVGLIVREERLRRILDVVKKESPDILVSTGDLVDGQIDNIEAMQDMLKEISPRYGKYAITGNHEFYAGLDHSISFTKSSGFRMLRGEGIVIEDMIAIAGVDDDTDRYFGGRIKVSEKELLSGLPQNMFILFLKHRPMIKSESLDLFDLQLSGHTHKGQIFPFSIATWLTFPVNAGNRALSERSMIHVSRGSGTWGPPVRFLSPPEVTIIELVRK